MRRMSENLISVTEFAAKDGLWKTTVFKVLKRLQIEPAKSHGESRIRSYISADEGRRVLEELASTRTSPVNEQSEDSELPDAVLYDIGVFYLLSLEPEHDPRRFKVGFASNLNDRVSTHRCSAPFAKVVGQWTCRRLWEKTAIECVTEGCERLHTEVCRAESLEAVKTKCEQFFALMPRLASRP